MESLIVREVLSWSPTAISAVLLFAVIILIKKMGVSESAHIERTNNLRVTIENKLASLNNAIDDKLTSLKTDTTKILDEHARRISHIELEYVRRETFYRELGGWKDDINRVSGQITDFTKFIIELWKEKMREQ
jgi:hypothetical protein